MDISHHKKQLRTIFLSRRNDLAPEQKAEMDRRICEGIWKKIEALQPRVIHTFLPINSEINFYPVIKRSIAAGITIVCPRALPNRRMSHLVLRDLSATTPGVMGTIYPSGENEYLGTYDLILVPGLAYDQRGHRLGYGGGYYDAFLKNHPDAFKLGLFYAFQACDKLPIGMHDVQLDGVVTEVGERGFTSTA
ncbi:MAG: 5-formyltetrahydrofolate cyclo-ligase [Cryomorphaceae bacterium]|nr:5-formyltetrahydrofolate cyclo-ligase [Cryomorphaceae bacterium]